MATRQDKKVYDFQSVGTSVKNIKESVIKKSTFPIGLKTPMEIGDKKNLYAMHYDLEKQIADNFRNLILTNYGERLGRYDFGANLLELSLELGSEDIDVTAMQRIKLATTRYMPFITLSGFSTDIEHFDNKDIAKVDVLITYIIPRLSSTKKHAIKIRLYTAG